jgi:SAM-dependent methyltransferase
MSWWFAPFYDGFMRRSEEACVRDWRRELLSDVRGDVLDLGAGTGANLPFFPRDAQLVAAEPDRAMARRLREHARQLQRTVDVVDANAESLPFANATFDAVVSTLVLCTVDDQERSIAEIKRVLKPGGLLVFLEHVASDDPSRYRWQRFFEPVYAPIAGGCHITRRTHEAIARAGFHIENIKHESMRKALPLFRPTVRGVATAR